MFEELVKVLRLKRGEISKLYKEGKRVRKLDYLGIYRKNSMRFPRIAVSIRRGLGNAVSRNYEKRVIKEVVREDKRLLKGLDIMIVKVSNETVGYNGKARGVRMLINEISRREKREKREKAVYVDRGGVAKRRC